MKFPACTRFQVAHVSDHLGYGPKFVTRKGAITFIESLVVEGEASRDELEILMVVA